MSLRKRLNFLLSAFAVFAVVASFATIYGVQLHVESAVTSFHRSMDQTGQVDHLRLAVRDQVARLRDVVNGVREPDESYLAEQDALFITLEEFVRFAPSCPSSFDWEEILRLTRSLRKEFKRCRTLARDSRTDDARRLLNERIQGDLLAALDARLQTARTVLDDSRRQSVSDLVATNTQVLILAAVVGVMGAGLVAVGAALIRRWLMTPISRLQKAIEEIGRGNLGLRIELGDNGELNALGDTLNRMAASLVKAQSDLHTSEEKYRSLFANLRDAVVICDVGGRVVEHHDGDAHLLGDENAANIGRHLLAIWPLWRSGTIEWSSLIDHVMRSGTQFRAAAAVLQRGDGGDEDVVVDLVAYPVEYGDARYAAIVLRDVTERERLAKQARQAETMEATVTLARGIAHDFTNLLTSATGTLSLLERNVSDTKQRERIETAARACWQAAGLASRLLNFATSNEGHPQVFCLAEVVELILHSLDEELLDAIQVRCDCDESVLVKIDRDQLTQIILNLIRNACEAMPGGGELRIKAEPATMNGIAGVQAGAKYSVLSIADSGSGMTPEVKQRIFEPFFTTKGRHAHHGRGMGLAVVYAAVNNAFGSIRVESHVGVGTEFQVHLPTGEGAPAPVELPVCTDPVKTGTGTIFLVEDNRSMLQACTEALERWGYSVVAADCGSDAQSMVASVRGHALDLAVIDVDLPDGNGLALARELLNANPKLRLIFTTSFTDIDLPKELEPQVRARLLKPFRFHTLAQTVSKTLSRP